ncbi:IclR family transcriptional regulator [Kribbella sp. NPDC054772]
MDDDTRSPLQTVDRALQILISYSEQRRDWGVMELADELGIDKSSAQRLLAALAFRGFLRSDPISRRYSLGPTMWRMAALWERTGGLAALADGVLERLAHDTNRTTTFTIPDGFHVRCIAAVDGGGGPLRSHPLLGDLYPAHAGATSRAYFAFLDRNERRALLSGRPFARFTDLTEVDEVALEQVFEDTVQTGWAFSDGEYDAATRAIAAPVRLGRRPIGSLTVAEGKSEELIDDIRDHVPRLLEATEELSNLLLAHRTPAARNRRR